MICFNFPLFCLFSLCSVCFAFCRSASIWLPHSFCPKICFLEAQQTEWNSSSSSSYFVCPHWRQEWPVVLTLYTDDDHHFHHHCHHHHLHHAGAPSGGKQDQWSNLWIMMIMIIIIIIIVVIIIIIIVIVIFIIIMMLVPSLEASMTNDLIFG